MDFHVRLFKFINSGFTDKFVERLRETELNSKHQDSHDLHYQEVKIASQSILIYLIKCIKVEASYQHFDY